MSAITSGKDWHLDNIEKKRKKEKIKKTLNSNNAYFTLLSRWSVFFSDVCHDDHHQFNLSTQLVVCCWLHIDTDKDISHLTQI